MSSSLSLRTLLIPALIACAIPVFLVACQSSSEPSGMGKRSAGTAPKNGTAQTKQQTADNDSSSASTCSAQCGEESSDDAESIDSEHEKCVSECDSDTDCVNDCDLSRQSACAELQCTMAGDD